MIYNLIKPKTDKVPIIVSVPHSGIDFPKDQRKKFKKEAIASLDDTDWFVDKLYDFVSDMGITIISAKYHRWLIDLNRNAESKPLYGDGRVITGLTPTTDFNGELIYNDKYEPNEIEIKARLDDYYHPYYDGITSLLNDLHKDFKHVLFYDAHSIRQYVPGIRSEKFPDLILGDVDETSASHELINVTKNILGESNYSFAHNHPFKGGNLTRHFGNPSQNRHALQLEMSKLVYMDDDEREFSYSRAEQIQDRLKRMFQGLIRALENMNNIKPLT